MKHNRREEIIQAIQSQETSTGNCRPSKYHTIKIWSHISSYKVSNHTMELVQCELYCDGQAGGKIQCRTV